MSRRQVITKEMIESAYRALKEKLGRQPKVIEFVKSGYYIPTLNRLYGNPGWNNFLESIGEHKLKTRSCRTTRDQVEAAYGYLCQELGRQPTMNEFEKACCSWYVLDHLYGQPGWRNFLASVGDAPLIQHGTTKEMVESAYHALKEKLGRQPTSLEFIEQGYFIQTLVRLYGKPGWSKFLESVGEEPLKRKVTKGMAISAYWVLKERLGRQPKMVEYQLECHSLATLKRLYGKNAWSKLLKFVGEKPLTSSKKITKAMAESAYLALRDKLGRQPKMVEYRTECYSMSTLAGIYGNPPWSNFLKSIGEDPLCLRNITKSMFESSYRALKESLGRQPTEEEYERKCYSVSALRRYYGAKPWSKLLKSFGDKQLPPHSHNQRIHFDSPESGE